MPGISLHMPLPLASQLHGWHQSYKTKG
jgi:hypothetical protein